jgi:DNA processing protein
MTSESTVEGLLGDLNAIEQKHAPKYLYYRGDRSLLRGGPRVSIIGSRSASPDGLKRATKLTRALVSRGVVVVSGLAEGIDTAAHAAAIEAGGQTIAVLGSPLDTAYPASNEALLDFISAHHLAISQFAGGTPIQSKNFPMRNRTMALVSHATVIVEATETSGTRYQAWEALRLGRPLFLLESLARNSRLAWPWEVRRHGAQVLSDATFEGLVEQLPARAVAF